MKWTVGSEAVVSARQYTNAWRWPIWENERVMPRACGKSALCDIGCYRSSYQRVRIGVKYG